MKLTALIENTPYRPAFRAEHGLSLYIETGAHKILFDMGRSEAYLENAARCGVDLAAVDLAVLSHGHYDHGGGLAAFLRVNDHAPVYLSRYAFEPHLHGEDRDIGLDPALRASDRLVFTGDTRDLGDGLTLLSCNGCAPVCSLDSAGLTTRRDGVLLPEDFRHEQYLLVEEGGKRILISGCSHKGILNLMHWLRPDVLVGGFHFKDLDPDKDREALCAAADALSQYDTDYFTCHCTGLPQYDLLKSRMGARLHYLAAGQQITL